MKFNFLLAGLLLAPQACTAQTILEVNRLGSTPYKTIAAAVKVVQPGDTIRLKADSGPYREILHLKTSGTAEKPIVFDGNGNTITGFEPITNWEEKDGVISSKLSVFPCVLTYKGERIVQDYTTGQFTKYADLNEAKDTLTLRAGVDKTDWEVSKRAFSVLINSTSHQIYRNIRASGSTNDGFNLHGTGTGLVFENVEGFHNLDEGYSSHDSIVSIISDSKFWSNDNGIANSYSDNETVSTTLKNVDIYDNLGFGLVLHDCSASLGNVRSWNNGASQIRFGSAKIASENVVAYTPTFPTRIWASYTESKTSNAKSPATPMLNNQVIFTGTPPVIEVSSTPK